MSVRTVSLLTLLLLIAPVAADIPPHASEKELEDPNWWWEHHRGPVWATRYPEVWNKIVLKYEDPEDREKVSKLGEALRHPPRGFELWIWFILGMALVLPPASRVGFLKFFKYKTWEAPEWLIQYCGTIILSMAYLAIIAMGRAYVLNCSVYYVMIGKLSEAYRTFYLWTAYAEPFLLAFNAAIPLILVSKLELPYRRLKAGILIAWLASLVLNVHMHSESLTLLSTLGG
ncbi:hypothetical protein [Methanopyrus kandleri]|nr:hypothetical protein [Methanopyrus kandleri]HII69788.1 hypothetical protein [Methanopyrus kandleri]